MRIFLSLVALLAAMGFCHSSLAVSISNSASVEIVDPAQLQGQTEFPVFQIDKKDIGNVQINVGYDGSISKSVIGSGANDIVARGEVDSSEGYDIVVSKENSVQIDIKNKNKDSSMALVNVVAQYNGQNIKIPYINQSNTSKNNKLKLGAILSVGDKAKPGSYSPAFEIALHYE